MTIFIGFDHQIYQSIMEIIRPTNALASVDHASWALLLIFENLHDACLFPPLQS